MATNCSLSCKYSHWRDVGSCSEPCGPGDQLFGRDVLQGDPDECNITSMVGPCNLGHCIASCTPVGENAPWPSCGSACVSDIWAPDKEFSSFPLTRTLPRISSIGNSSACPPITQTKWCQPEVQTDCRCREWIYMSNCSGRCPDGHGTRTVSRRFTVGNESSCGPTTLEIGCTVACDQNCTVSELQWSSCSNGAKVSVGRRMILQEQLGRGAACPPLMETKQCAHADHDCHTRCEPPTFGECGCGEFSSIFGHQNISSAALEPSDADFCEEECSDPHFRCIYPGGCTIAENVTSTPTPLTLQRSSAADSETSAPEAAAVVFPVLLLGITAGAIVFAIAQAIFTVMRRRRRVISKKEMIDWSIAGRDQTLYHEFAFDDLGGGEEDAL